MDKVLLVLAAAGVGYFAKWAELKWLTEPRALHQKEQDRLQAVMTDAAAVLRPALQALRTTESGKAIEADPSGKGWWPEIHDPIRHFIDEYRDDWMRDMDKDHAVSMRVAQMLGSYAEVQGSTSVGNPAYVVFGYVKELSKSVGDLHTVLVRRSKGDWGPIPEARG
jgi:hypothetical protein